MSVTHSPDSAKKMTLTCKVMMIMIMIMIIQVDDDNDAGHEAAKMVVGMMIMNNDDADSFMSITMIMFAMMVTQLWPKCLYVVDDDFDGGDGDDGDVYDHDGDI